MFVDLSNSYFYIFTHVYLWIYIYHVPTTYLLYICYIKLYFFHLCSFCCFSEMLFIMKILIIDMLGICQGYSDMTWWMSFLPLWRGIYSCGPNFILYSTYTSVYIQNIFSTSFIFVGMANHITCTFAFEFSITFSCIDAYDNSYQVAHLMKNLQTHLLIFSWIRLRSSDLNLSNQICTQHYHRTV